MKFWNIPLVQNIKCFHFFATHHYFLRKMYFNLNNHGSFLLHYDSKHVIYSHLGTCILSFLHHCILQLHQYSTRYALQCTRICILRERDHIFCTQMISNQSQSNNYNLYLVCNPVQGVSWWLLGREMTLDTVVSLLTRARL